MKKRIAALLCALVLVLRLMPVSATDSVFFTAVNDNLLPLTSSTMPFWTNGYLYIPASLFNPGTTTARQLGVTSSLSNDKKTLVLFARNALVFNLETGSTTDGQNESYPESAVTRGGQVFVPASRVASFFQLTYSGPITITPYGYVVRISRGAVMSDALFLDSATTQFTARYNDYKQVSSAGPAEPAVPVTPPEETVPEGSQILYLSLLAEDPALVSTWLDTLDLQGKSRAAVYFPATLLESAGDLTRRMNATGHTIGLWADASLGTEDALAQLEVGNRLLCRNTGSKTRLAFLANATEQTVEQVRAAGWRLLSAKVDYSARGLTGSTGAAALLKRVSAYSGSVTVWLGGNVTQNGLRSFLSTAREAQDKFLPLTELVQ